MSKDKLEAIFGKFKEPKPDLFKAQPEESYIAIPLHLGPNRDELYTEFQAEMVKRIAVLEDIWTDTKAHIDLTQDMFKQEKEFYAKAKKIPMLRHDQMRVMETIRKKESELIDHIRLKFSLILCAG